MLNMLLAIKARGERAFWTMLAKRRMAAYLKGQRHPWSDGYDEYRAHELAQVLKSDDSLAGFRGSPALPTGYGVRLDARLCELPWALARLPEGHARVLDAGSSLNHMFVLESPALANKDLTIVTLAPERQAFWQLGVSYAFGDLRSMYFKDASFDVVVCVSTLEHVGMDNSRYADADAARPSGSNKDWVSAVLELKRVLRPTGLLLVTVPFGRYENHGWFQQFNNEMIDELIRTFAPHDAERTFFKYEPAGWTVSDEANCSTCSFFDVMASGKDAVAPDFAAGERAVACLALSK